MNDELTLAVQKNYDQVAAEYARHIFDELRHKPLDRGLLDRFAAEIRGRGEACDMGCGPGHVARYLRDAGLSVFGLDLSPGMLEQARKLNPESPFGKETCCAWTFRMARWPESLLSTPL